MPVNVQLPAPDLVKVPEPEIIPEIVASPVPPKIAAAAVVSVMAPDAVAALALLFTKEPLIANGSAVVKPFKSTKAFNTIVVAVVVPKAALFPNFNVPVLTNAVLLNVLTPLNIQVPVPFFVNVPEPLITPDAVARPAPAPPKIAAVVSMISPDAVAAFALLFTKDPLILKSSAVVNPFKSTKAPKTIVVVVFVPKASLLPSIKVPAPTDAVELNVFTPLNSQVPVSFFVNVPVPLIIPDAVAIPVPVPPKIAAVVRVISPDAVAGLGLLFTKEPLSENGSAVVKPFKLTVAPNAIVVAPDTLPKALLLPNVNVPAFTVVVLT